MAWYEYRPPTLAEKARADLDKDDAGLGFILQGAFLILAPGVALALIVLFLLSVF